MWVYLGEKNTTRKLFIQQSVNPYHVCIQVGLRSRWHCNWTRKYNNSGGGYRENLLKHTGVFGQEKIQQ